MPVSKDDRVRAREHWVRCIDCQRGINGDKSCGAGAFDTAPELGCFMGHRIEKEDKK